MAKYTIIRYWICGDPIDQSDFDTLDELYQIPMIKEYTQKENFKELRWNSIYGMPSVGPHVSILELLAIYVDGSKERICNINEVDGLGLSLQPFELGNIYTITQLD